MVNGPPPIRMSRPPAACRATYKASAGLASMKWNVVPPCNSIVGRVVGQDEDRSVERGVVAPPTFPFLDGERWCVYGAGRAGRVQRHLVRSFASDGLIAPVWVFVGVVE